MLRKPNMLLFARFAITAHLGLSASTSMEFKLRNLSFEFWSHQTPASSHPPPRNSSFGIQAPSKPAPAFIKPPRQLRHIHLHGIQASNFGHINPPRQSVASTSKKFKLRISATSTLHPRPIGGVRCARRAIAFVLCTLVANDGRGATVVGAK